MGMLSWGEIEFLFKLVCFNVVIIINIGEVYLMDLGFCEVIVEVKLEIVIGL